MLQNLNGVLCAGPEKLRYAQLSDVGALKTES